MSNEPQCRPTQTIAILQYNLNKNQSTTHSVLNDSTSSKYAILMLQEQYFSTYTNSSLTHHSWTLVKSKRTENNSPRVAIYVNKTILSAHSYELIAIEISDIVAMAIRTDQKQHSTLIINIYNTKKSMHLANLRTYLRKHLRNNVYNAIIVAGDFNLHHPLWNPCDYHEHDSEAEVLINTMTQAGLKPMLPADTITFPGTKTTIDLV